MDTGAVEKDAPPKLPYPKSVFFIVSNEFCERFSYYGMKAILTIYLMNYLAYSKNDATSIYHVFSMACYFTPVIGAIISDSWLGKFRTIFYISIIYAIGNVVLAIAAIHDVGVSNAVGVSMLGLALIAFGTGGIKPCVAAFGGDQFGPGQEAQLEKFFSIFYISINAGSLISTFVTPALRANVTCWGQECFTLAFGLPAVLMVVALIIFVVGKPMYKMNPPEGNMVVEVVSCIGHALVKKSKKNSGKKNHWLDFADDKYDRKLIEDIKAVLKVLFLYLPLPFFWALFDQQGSRWTIQAISMDGRVTKNWRIEPDQVQVVNPILIVLCIPLFQFAVYPVFKKLHFLTSPLQKMTAGGVLAAVAFVLAYFVETKIQATLPVLPENNFGQLNVINGLPCDITFSWPESQEYKIGNGTFQALTSVPAKSDGLSITVAGECATPSPKYTLVFSSSETRIDTLLIVKEENKDIAFVQQSDSLNKPDQAKSDIRIFFNLPSKHKNSKLELKYNDKRIDLQALDVTGSSGYTNYSNVAPESEYSLILNGSETIARDINLQPGGRYLLYIKKDLSVQQNIVVQPNTVSLAWQIPQYVVITWGEIMFSITGLEFSYSQAPTSMKSVLQAGWLMTVAFGNLIVVLVASFSLLSQAYEFLLFAGLMVVDMIIFAIMAYFYKPVDLKAAEEQQAPPLSEKPRLSLSNGQDNPAFASDPTTKDATTKM